MTRHQRIALHEDASESPDEPPEPDSPPEPDAGEQHHGPVEADLAAAVSLSGMSVWPHHQQPAQPAELYAMAVSRNGTLVDDGSYQQGLLAEPFYENGMSLGCNLPHDIINEADQIEQGNQDAVGFDAHFSKYHYSASTGSCLPFFGMLQNATLYAPLQVTNTYQENLPVSWMGLASLRNGARIFIVLTGMMRLSTQP